MSMILINIISLLMMIAVKSLILKSMKSPNMISMIHSSSKTLYLLNPDHHKTTSPQHQTNSIKQISWIKQNMIDNICSPKYTNSFNSFKTNELIIISLSISVYSPSIDLILISIFGSLYHSILILLSSYLLYYIVSIYNIHF